MACLMPMARLIKMVRVIKMVLYLDTSWEVECRRTPNDASMVIS